MHVLASSSAAVWAGGSMAVLQMPRGNLEAVYPRVLTRAALAAALEVQPSACSVEVWLLMPVALFGGVPPRLLLAQC